MVHLKTFFWFCSGADQNLLKKCPTESSKYFGIGATVFFTGIFAWIAAAYALYTVFDHVIAAVVIGALWGLMIFNLDRYIVSSMRKQGGMTEFVKALPRFLLAILISIVIARPLELKIFEKEIAPELTVMQQEQYKVQESIIRNKFSPRQDSLQNEIANLQLALEQQRARRDELIRLAREEADGTGGSRKRSPGPIYRIKQQQADQAEQELREMSARNIAQIQTLQRQVGANDSLINREIASLEREPINGPAARMEALDRVTRKSTAIWMAHWFILLLFIAVETSPVLVKILSPKGPYDRLLNIEEHQFFVNETDAIAKRHAATKLDGHSLPQTEKTFVQERLDASLKNI